MKIGHICLANNSNQHGDRVAALVESLAAKNIEQHVLVASVMLARRLAEVPDVTVGPVVKTPVMAYCLMPDVDLAHIHEVKSGQAGLLLTLTRTIPYVISAENDELGSKNPLTRSVFHRTAQLVPAITDEPVDKIASEYLGAGSTVRGDVLLNEYSSDLLLSDGGGPRLLRNVYDG